MAGQIPQPGGDQRDQTKFIVFENFEKMNTQSVRQALSEKELAWLENLQPIAGNNLTTVPAVAAAALATITETISLMFYADLSGVDYFVVFTTAGSGYLVTISTGFVTRFASDGTFSLAPDVTTWQADRLLIADSKAGYTTFDGTIYVSQGGVSPNITVTNGGSGFAVAPTVTISGGSGTGATAVAVITGGVVTAVNLTNPGTGYLATDTLTVAFSSPPGSGAAGHVTMTGSAVTSLSVQSGAGRAYTNGTFAITFSGGGGTGASGTVTISGAGASITPNLTAGGSAYTSMPLAYYNQGGGSIVYFNAFLGTQTVATIVLDSGGSSYAGPATVTISGGSPFTQATATSTEAGGAITSLTLTNVGLYPPGVVPTVIIGAGAGVTAIAHVWPFINSSIAAYAFTTIAVFQGRVWLGGGQLLTWTGTGATYGNVGYDDFLTADASGSLIVSDADLIHAITALRSLNNYLFIMGDQSVKQIGNISLDATGEITLFTILTLSSDQGTIYPKSCISYNRVFLFANTNGIYGVFGSSVQKLSGDMDGIFKLIDFTQVPQGALADINAIHNAVFLVRYKDPIEGERSIMLTFDGKKWYIISQGNSLTAIATSASLATGENSLYGSSGPDVTNLLAVSTTAVSFKIQSSLTHHGNAVQGKKVIRAGFSSNLVTGPSSVTMTVDTDNTSSTYTMDIASGFHLVGGANDANNAAISGAGIYLGETITGTEFGYTITNMVMEYQETALWKAK